MSPMGSITPVSPPTPSHLSAVLYPLSICQLDQIPHLSPSLSPNHLLDFSTWMPDRYFAVTQSKVKSIPV